MKPAQGRWTPPDEFDGYRLLRPIGQGRMGQVYLGHDTVLDRQVAVKFIAINDPDPDDRERFLVEARAVARLQHPNVVAIYRVGEVQARPYLVSEFIRGEGLDRIAKPVLWSQVLRIGICLARGLAAAHRHGVLHRDIKPANAILSPNGEAKLLDFGLAKLLSVLPSSTEGGGPSAAASAAQSRSQLESESQSQSQSESPQAHSRSSGGLPANDAVAFGATLMSRERARSAVPGAVPAGTPVASLLAPGRAPGLPPADHEATLSFIGPLDGDVAGSGAAVVQNHPRRPEAPDEAHSGAPPDEVHLTRPGLVMGTPLYMAPEVWTGKPATYRSDIYSLGSLLFYLCTGRPPHDRSTLSDLRKAVLHEKIPLLSERASVDPRFAAVVHRCLERDPQLRYASGDEVREALEQLTPEGRAPVIPEGNPYRGLHAFDADHRALFFGRDAEIRAIVERLRTDPFVLVAGDSGVGKSSLCRAGVLPRVCDGALGGGRSWSVVPLVPGRHPLQTLTAALAPFLGTDEEALARTIAGEFSAIGRELRRHGAGVRDVLVYVDQMEELVTLSDPVEAAAFARVMGWLAARTPGVRLLATVRGDFLTRLAALPSLADELPRALYVLRPLSRDGIREAIVGPSRAKGVSFRPPDLIETLVESTARTDGGLPLLQFALAELWDARDQAEQVIPSAALEKIGGVAGALARHADGVVAGLLPEQRAAARRVLTQLVTADGTRARRTEQELGTGETATRGALDALVRGRLLVAHEEGGNAAYEVAHEALLHGWPMLRRWLDEDADARVVRDRLAVAVTEWERLGRVSEALWSARQLAEVQKVAPAYIGPRESAFLAASRGNVKRGRLARRVLAVGIPLILVLAWGSVRVRGRYELAGRVAVHVGEGRSLLDEARKHDAEAQAARARAFALFDEREAQAAEEAWSHALTEGAELDRLYTRAAQALETALTLDGKQKEARGLFADVLYERALLAERDRHPALRDELLQRLALYDDGGVRRNQWNAPALVTLMTSPRGARVLLERYVRDDRQHRRPQTVGELGKTPIVTHPFEPGSYLLQIQAPGRVTVRVPLVLARAERVELSVGLPEPAQVPEDFIYIPPGRFLFGSADDESMRREFLSTVPMHEVKTGAYLIARHETTFADWLDYLRALPMSERTRRTPKVATVTFRGALELMQLAGGNWQLRFQPTTAQFVARAGERVLYAARTRRRIQDWLRFPVLGISAEDAEAYVAWLAQSGRVPGARLCTEYEWERGARGADDRQYPHGDRLDPDDANYAATYGAQPVSFGPDEVGSHPASRSPFDLDDMAGNVWEWTQSSLSTEEHAVRGGGYYYGEKTIQTANREIAEPTLHDINIGMRVCANPFVR